MKTRITRLPSVVAVLGITAGLLPPQLAARQSLPPRVGTVEFRPGIPASDGELTAAVRAHVTRGDFLTGAGRYAEAQREYHGAAEIARREGHLPSLTLWHLACAHYYGGDRRGAAAVLEQLSFEATQVGDLVVEALALFDAAWLNGQSGRGREAATQVTDLSRLLRSPYMPATVRDQLVARLAMPSDVAVIP